MKKRTIPLRVRIMILVIGVLGICCAAYIMWNQLRSQHGKYARIYQNGILVRTVSLEESDKSYTFRVEDGDAYNIIQVKNGRIGVLDASCPDKLCVKRGLVSETKLPVVCLPNHVTIQITEDEDTVGTDSTSY